jgi:hypothetical protein
MTSDIDFLFAHLPREDADILHEVIVRHDDAVLDGAVADAEISLFHKEIKQTRWSSPSSARIIRRILAAARA